MAIGGLLKRLPSEEDADAHAKALARIDLVGPDLPPKRRAARAGRDGGARDSEMDSLKRSSGYGQGAGAERTSSWANTRVTAFALRTKARPSGWMANRWRAAAGAGRGRTIRMVSFRRDESAGVSSFLVGSKSNGAPCGGAGRAGLAWIGGWVTDPRGRGQQGTGRWCCRPRGGYRPTGGCRPRADSIRRCGHPPTGGCRPRRGYRPKAGCCR